MTVNEKKSYRIELIVAFIGVIGVLGGALLSNWDKIFPQRPTPVTPIVTESQTSQKPPNRVREAIDTQAYHQTETQPVKTVEAPRLYRADWAYRYFHPCKAGTYNVIVKSLEGDQYAGVNALRDFGARFPDVAFRLVNTVAMDGASNQRFAIFSGNGLTRPEAVNLTALVKKMHLADDAYMVLQGWDADAKSADDWEIMR